MLPYQLVLVFRWLRNLALLLTVGLARLLFAQTPPSLAAATDSPTQASSDPAVPSHTMHDLA